MRVPPRRIPAHFQDEVRKQLDDMLSNGIIEESNSPWMAPAVFARKTSGELRLCVDYRALNKKTVSDAYPIPLVDEVQDQLSGSTIFSTLDLRCGYWQMPVHESDQQKTAFCPGPGLGLFEFKRMPFGLSNAPSSFQRMMNKLFRDLPFVTTYIDDILVHSSEERTHRQHLQEVFDRLREAGLTLRGSKCHIGMSEVSYLGHVFSAQGMRPDEGKVRRVQEWPVPTDVMAVKQFLGLASYYRRYTQNFAEIARPLNNLAQKNTPFVWSPECEAAFQTLKAKLTTSPILAYPNLGPSAPTFELHTDASNNGLGTVLEQDGHVIAYASRTLTKSEKNYSVIQKECLAIVYAAKQFRHYLLGRPFKLLTDHKPLQWLAEQKMDGMLGRWALALQEYEFEIIYKPGKHNGNADALSRRESQDGETCATTLHSPLSSQRELRVAQQDDPIISQLLEALSKVTPSRPRSQHPTVRRYAKLWSQLRLVDGIVCRTYTPGPAMEVVTVPILPKSLIQQALLRVHDVASAGHQGRAKTLEKLRQQAYWVNMASDVQTHCQECVKCQQTKPTLPTKVPLTSMPIGSPWQMVAVDVLEVPLSVNNNKYLLVIQDYFTKWADAIPMPDQKAQRITKELVKVFATFGLPQILHSDQGRNFESAILKQTLDAFGVSKSHTTAYHPQGDGMVERFNRSLLQMLRAYAEKEADWEQYLPLVLFAYRTSVHSSTRTEPFTLMFGRPSQLTPFPPKNSFDTTSYSAHLQAKLAELQDFVEANLAEAADSQKKCYDTRTEKRTFRTGQLVWLSIPTAKKLDPRWEGGWRISEVMSPINMKISDGQRTRVVHVNRLRHRIQPQPNDPTIPLQHQTSNWYPPQIEHLVVSDTTPTPTQPLVNIPRYPCRIRQPPERYM